MFSLFTDAESLDSNRSQSSHNVVLCCLSLLCKVWIKLLEIKKIIIIFNGHKWINCRVKKPDLGEEEEEEEEDGEYEYGGPSSPKWRHTWASCQHLNFRSTARHCIVLYCCSREFFVLYCFIWLEVDWLCTFNFECKLILNYFLNHVVILFCSFKRLHFMNYFCLLIWNLKFCSSDDTEQLDSKKYL